MHAAWLEMSDEQLEAEYAEWLRGTYAHVRTLARARHGLPRPASARARVRAAGACMHPPCRTDGPGARRLQRRGFSRERDAAEALERALKLLRRQKGVGSTLTLKELVEEYLAQHDAEPETIEKLCWLLAKALRLRRPPPS
jgi:hypothetical protein